MKKWKLKKFFFFFKDWTTYFKYPIYPCYSMNFMILLHCFVICNVLGHFLPFQWFSCFSILWKMRSAKRQATFIVSISQLNKTSYSIKSRDQRLLGMVWEQRIQYWQFFALELNVWALNYIHTSSYFTHIYKKTVWTTLVL